MSKNKQNLIWIELEMTGLNPAVDRIIEIATIVTDEHLNEIAEGPVMAIHQSDHILGNMNEWCVKHHNQSGLVDRVRESAFTEAEAEAETIAFLQQHVPAGVSPMCGNTICQDRRFLYRHMPKLEQFFHYRFIDVSTVKELAKRWRPDIMPSVEKESAHLALADIRESIAELRYYRQHFINLNQD